MPKQLSLLKPEQHTSFITKEVCLFLIVGVINTLFGYGCFAAFIYLGFHYTIAVLLATCIGIIFNFNTIGRIVFKAFNYNLIIKFISVYILLYMINIALLKMLGNFSANFYLTGFIAILPMAILGFIFNKFFVFRVAHEIN